MPDPKNLLRLLKWIETPVFERADGIKVTRVDAEFQYEGDLEGPTTLGYQMIYYRDGTGSYSGWERFKGNYRGAPSEVVLAHRGTFDATAVRCRVTSVEGTGSGGLTSAHIEFSSILEGQGPYPIELLSRSV